MNGFFFGGGPASAKRINVNSRGLEPTELAIETYTAQKGPYQPWKISFSDELRKLLVRFGVQFDEKYLV